LSRRRFIGAAPPIFEESRAGAPRQLDLAICINRRIAPLRLEMRGGNSLP
jgi:hypothetical protein